MRKEEIACNKQFLLFSQCLLPYMALIFHFKCTLKCRLQFVSIWTSLKFCRLVIGLFPILPECCSVDANVSEFDLNSCKVYFIFIKQCDNLFLVQLQKAVLVRNFSSVCRIHQCGRSLRKD